METQVYTVNSPNGPVQVVGPVGASEEEIIAQAKRLSAEKDEWKGDQRIPASIRYPTEIAKNIGPNIPEAIGQMAQGVENLATGKTFKDIYNMARAVGARGMRAYAGAKGGPADQPSEAEQPLTDLIETVKDVTPEDIAKFGVTRPAEAGVMLGGLSRGRLDPMTLAARGAGGAAGAAAPRLMRNAAGIRRSDMEKGLDLGREMAREGIGPTQSGLRKSRNIMEELGPELDELVSAHPYRTPKHVLTKDFDDLMKKYEKRPEGQRRIAEIKRIKNEFLNEFGDRRMITSDELQNWKTGAYKDAYQRSASLDIEEAKGPRTVATRQSARNAKNELEARIPGYADINQRWQTAAQAEPYIKARIDAAPPTGVFAKLWKNVAHDKVKSGAAQFLQRVSDGPKGKAMSWLEQNFNTPEIRAILYLTGEEEE